MIKGLGTLTLPLGTHILIECYCVMPNKTFNNSYPSRAHVQAKVRELCEKDASNKSCVKNIASFSLNIVNVKHTFKGHAK